MPRKGILYPKCRAVFPTLRRRVCSTSARRGASTPADVEVRHQRQHRRHAGDGFQSRGHPAWDGRMAHARARRSSSLARHHGSIRGEFRRVNIRISFCNTVGHLVSAVIFAALLLALLRRHQ